MADDGKPSRDRKDDGAGGRPRRYADGDRSGRPFRRDASRDDRPPRRDGDARPRREGDRAFGGGNDRPFRSGDDRPRRDGDRPLPQQRRSASPGW